MSELAGDSKDDLLMQAQKGDRAALNSLVTNHWGSVFHTALLSLRNHHDAEEATQEAFLRTVRHLSTIKVAFRAFTMKTLCNYISSLQKRRGIVGFESLPVSGAGPVSGNCNSSGLMSEERQRAVEESLGALLEMDRIVVVHRFWGGLSLPEIAEAMGLTHGYVKNISMRAMDHLEALLGDAHGGNNA